jgi:hypothetical protein
MSQVCTPGNAKCILGQNRKINSREIQGPRKDFPPAHRHPAITTNAAESDDNLDGMKRIIWRRGLRWESIVQCEQAFPA